MYKQKNKSLLWMGCGAIILSLFLFVFLVDNCHCSDSPKYFKWRFSNQNVMQMPDASGLHLIGSAYLAGSFDNSMKWWEADLLSLGIGTAWEVKDALVPWERIGILGGEGFSWGDIQMDLTGIISHRLFVLFYNRYKYKIWSFNSQKK